MDASDNPTAYISEKWKGIYEDLCKGDTIFEQMTNLFTLCAAIGHQNQKHDELKNKKDIFKWVNLNAETDIPILTAIAWDYEKRDLAVLSDQRKIIEITSEFSEGGMQYLFENFFEDHMQDGRINRPAILDIEFNLAQIIEGIRQKRSLF